MRSVQKVDGFSSISSTRDLVDRQALSPPSRGLRYASCVDEPRFSAGSIDELIELAQRADPPIQPGDVAELELPKRRVRVQVQRIDPLAVWDEVR